MRNPLTRSMPTICRSNLSTSTVSLLGELFSIKGNYKARSSRDLNGRNEVPDEDVYDARLNADVNGGTIEDEDTTEGEEHQGE